MAAYEPFTPSNSEQRLPPPYYRGCWHGVSRGFFSRYRQTLRLLTRKLFFPIERSLRSENLRPPRGVASSGLRPLRTIPHCCLPEESGPCLSPSVAVRPLRPATDRCLGEPLPHQLANRTRAPLQALGLAIPSFDLRLLKGRMSCGISVPFETLSPTRRQVTHALLTRLPLSCPLRGNRVRLACVRHAASVDSEPGSNSHVRWFASRGRMFSTAIGQH